MIAPVPQSSAGETRSLLGNHSEAHTKHGSALYRARRAPIAVACVVAMALFTDMVVYGVVVPILPIIVEERLGGSSSAVGLLFACYAIGLLASTPFFAIMSDKYQNRRIPMMVGMLGLAVATVGFSLASNYWVLAIARIGQGSAGGASWTIGLGMLADVYPPDNLGAVMGATMMANAIGFMLGPVIGSYFYEYHGYKAPFIFCAALAILDFLCILFIAEPEKRKYTASADSTKPIESPESNQTVENDVDALTIRDEQAPATTTVVAVEATAASISDLKHAQKIVDDGLNLESHKIDSHSQSNYGSASTSSSSSSAIESTKDNEDETDVSMFTIASDWTIICCLLATFVAASVFSGLEPILPLYLKEFLHATPMQTGLIFIAAVFPTLFASVIGYYSDRVGHFYISLLGMVIFAIATLSLALPTSFLSFILPLALFGLGSSMILTPLLPAMADVVNKKRWNCYAKTYALYNMTYSLSMAAGPILAGFIFQDFGFRWTMVMFGVMIIVATPVIFSSQIAIVLAKWRGAQNLSASSSA
ncbi:hypothetical protein BGX27_007389 [Mortierella sp. AM989]|nr:hypothetical protein BGX27_007389 [Mortierella sp. AM989]